MNNHVCHPQGNREVDYFCWHDTEKNVIHHNINATGFKIVVECQKHRKRWKQADNFERFGGNACEDCVRILELDSLKELIKGDKQNKEV